MARNSANGYPTGGIPTKGRSGKRGAREEGCQLDELDCLRSLEQVIPPDQVQQQWLGHFHLVVQWSPMPHLDSGKELLKKCTMALALLIPPGLPL